MNKKLPDPKVGRKSQNMAVKKSDKRVILAPHDVNDKYGIMLFDNPPSYDFRQLANLIPNADLDRLNRNLNSIYIAALHAEIEEHKADAKTTKRALKRLSAAHKNLPDTAEIIVTSELKRALIENGIHVPEGMDAQLWASLAGSILRSSLVEPSKPRGSRGSGARIRLAVSELVDLYCHERGCGRPYYSKSKGQWVKLGPIEFAAAVLRAWRLEPNDNPYTADRLAGIWFDARPK